MANVFGGTVQVKFSESSKMLSMAKMIKRWTCVGDGGTFYYKVVLVLLLKDFFLNDVLTVHQPRPFR